MEVRGQHVRISSTMWVLGMSSLAPSVFTPELFQQPSNKKCLRQSSQMHNVETENYLSKKCSNFCLSQYLFLYWF